MAGSDDRSGEDAGFDEAEEEFERHRRGLYDRVSAYMDEAELDEDYTAHLLVDAAVATRMAAYATGVENPSAAGLKLDLDRLLRVVEDLVRQGKKGAEGYIRDFKEARADAEGNDR